MLLLGKKILPVLDSDVQTRDHLFLLRRLPLSPLVSSFASPRPQPEISYSPSLRPETKNTLLCLPSHVLFSPLLGLGRRRRPVGFQRSRQRRIPPAPAVRPEERARSGAARGCGGAGGRGWPRGGGGGESAPHQERYKTFP
jgi:hypothetical protein